MIQSSNHESEDRHLKNVFKVSNMAGFYFDDFGRQNMKKNAWITICKKLRHH